MVFPTETTASVKIQLLAFDLKRIGSFLPCVSAAEKKAVYSADSDESVYRDSAALDLGAICSKELEGNRFGKPDERSFLLRIIYKLPDLIDAEFQNSEVGIGGGFDLDDILIVFTYDLPPAKQVEANSRMALTEVSTFADDNSDNYYFSLRNPTGNNGNLAPGGVFMLELTHKVQPGNRGRFDYEISPTKYFSVCLVKVSHVGKNFLGEQIPQALKGKHPQIKIDYDGSQFEDDVLGQFQILM